jgi:hypothetical protein
LNIKKSTPAPRKESPVVSIQTNNAPVQEIKVTPVVEQKPKEEVSQPISYQIEDDDENMAIHINIPRVLPPLGKTNTYFVFTIQLHLKM